MKLTKYLSGTLACGAMLMVAQAPAVPFTYQGRLTDNGLAATATYDIQLRLMTAVSGGTQLGTTQTFNDVSVVGGLFTVTPDFGASVNLGVPGQALEILVRPGASSGSYTTLTPRRPLNPAPSANSIYARTIVVRPTGTALQNGTAFSSAVSALAGSSASNPSMIILEAGFYDLGSTTLQVNEGIHIRGAGSNATFIDGQNNPSTVAGPIQMVGTTSLEGVQVRNFGGMNYSIGISRGGPGSLSMRDVAIYVTGGALECIGFLNRSNGVVRWQGGRITAEDVQTGKGVYFEVGTAEGSFRDIDVTMNLDPGVASTLTSISIDDFAPSTIDWQGGRIELDGGSAADTTLSLLYASSNSFARIRDIDASLANSESVVAFNIAGAADLRLSDSRIEATPSAGTQVAKMVTVGNGSTVEVRGCEFFDTGALYETYRGLEVTGASAGSKCIISDCSFTASRTAPGTSTESAWLAESLNSTVDISDTRFSATNFLDSRVATTSGTRGIQVKNVRAEFISTGTGTGLDLQSERNVIDGLSIDTRTSISFTGIYSSGTSLNDIRNVDLRVTELGALFGMSAIGIQHMAGECHVDGMTMKVDRHSVAAEKIINMEGIHAEHDMTVNDFRMDAVMQNSDDGLSSAYGLRIDNTANVRLTNSRFRFGTEGDINIGAYLNGGSIWAKDVIFNISSSTSQASGIGMATQSGDIRATECVIDFEGGVVGQGLNQSGAVTDQIYFDRGELDGPGVGGGATFSGAVSNVIFLSNSKIDNFTNTAWEQHIGCFTPAYVAIP